MSTKSLVCLSLLVFTFACSSKPAKVQLSKSEQAAAIDSDAKSKTLLTQLQALSAVSGGKMKVVQDKASLNEILVKCADDEEGIENNNGSGNNGRGEVDDDGLPVDDNFPDDDSVNNGGNNGGFNNGRDDEFPENNGGFNNGRDDEFPENNGGNNGGFNNGDDDDCPENDDNNGGNNGGDDEFPENNGGINNGGDDEFPENNGGINNGGDDEFPENNGGINNGGELPGIECNDDVLATAKAALLNLIKPLFVFLSEDQVQQIVDAISSAIPDSCERTLAPKASKITAAVLSKDDTKSAILVDSSGKMKKVKLPSTLVKKLLK